jgi:hypothetical protein
MGKKEKKKKGAGKEKTAMKTTKNSAKREKREKVDEEDNLERIIAEFEAEVSVSLCSSLH